MGFDAFAPFSPARINATLVPAGPVKATRFQEFMTRLQENRVVALSGPDERSGANSVSRPAHVIYDFSPPQYGGSFVDAFPFDLNRIPQVNIALADGNELLAYSGEDALDGEGSPYQTLLLDFERSRGNIGYAPRFLLLFDSPSSLESARENVFILSSAESIVKSTKSAVFALTSMLLAHLGGVVHRLETNAIESPRLGHKKRQDHSGPEVRPGTSNQLSHISEKSSNSASNSVASGDIRITQKARYKIVLGTFYLQAGRWVDALQELSDGAQGARSGSDYLWYGRSLEYILVCMLMLGWAGIGFEIPQICRPGVIEKGILAKSTQHTAPSSSNSNLTDENSGSKKPLSAGILQDLNRLIPSLISTIMTLYLRSSSFTQEKLPPTMMCEARIRFANLLIFSQVENPELDSDAMSLLILTPPPKSDRPIKPTTPIPRSRRTEISSLLIDAVTDSQSELSNIDLVYGLIAISSGLFRLGLDRKHAFYLKELLQRLVPCLVEARKVGAAEMGIHPAAGLSILSESATERPSHLRGGTENLLGMIGSLYGMPILGEIGKAATTYPEIDLLRRRLIDWNSSQANGDVTLRMEILRLCINVCEALPDLAAGLKFTVLLLRNARRTISVSSQTISGTPSLSTEEQSRLINNIKRTINAAPKIGLGDLRADYWDDFLVRDIRPLAAEGTDRLIPHSSHDLELVVGENATGKRDPFIYNPFSKTKTANETTPVLVMGEMAHFVVTLQNPYEFELEIDYMSLLTNGCSFEAKSHNTTLGHFCTQDFIVSGIPQSSGNLEVVGCRVAIRNCKERNFQIFSRDWHSPVTTKLKWRNRSFGFGSLLSEDSKLQPAEIKSLDEFLQPHVLSVTVIKPQPDIRVMGTNLSQPSLMLLEGERKEFELTLQNASKTAVADLLLFAVEDSVSARLQTAVSDRELLPAELYEVQFQLASNSSIRLKYSSENENLQLPCDSVRTFTFEAFGKPGLTNAVIQINYAFLGISQSEIAEKFYTRQISFELALTVNASVDIPRFNILPLGDKFAWDHEHAGRFNGVPAEDELHGLQSYAAENSLGPPLPTDRQRNLCDSFCLAVVDFRNIWPHPIEISVKTRKTDSNSGITGTKKTVSDVLQPGHVSRLVFLLPRIFITDPSAPVPVIGNQRQFVVSASKMSIEVEAATREVFWYREELLKNIEGTWRELDSGREGIIDFRKAVRLSPRMIEAVRVDHVEIDFLIKPFHGESSSIDGRDEECVQQLGRSHFSLHTETFATLTVRVHNRTQERLLLVLRLQPSIRNQPHSIALELSKRFAWSGVLQRALHPVIEPGDVREAQLGIIALVEGQYEIGATVEEIQGRRPSTGPKESLSTLSADRRFWHAREPCLIDAVEAKRVGG